MKVPPQSFSVNVDPTNPGQFFACCGLLELADRLWPGAEGWFGEDGRQFHVSCGEHTLTELLNQLAKSSATAIERLECNGLEVAGIIRPLRLDFSSDSSATIELDAWIRIAIEKGEAKVGPNPPWNFWSGQQTSFGIWIALQAEFTKQLKTHSEDQIPDLFSQRLFQKGRFGFDPGPPWNALDVGFSPNEHSLSVESSPATEMLAAIGIQRFRPIMQDDLTAFTYFTWNVALSPSVAAAAANGAIRNATTQQFRAHVLSRGQYAALSVAYSISSSGDSNV